MTTPAAAALQAQWRSRLRKCTSLSDSDLTEIEAHLQDSTEDLKARGLSEDEAFLIAARRLGQPELLEAEFARQKTRRYPKWSWMTTAAPAVLLVVVLTYPLWSETTARFHFQNRGIRILSFSEGTWISVWVDFTVTIALPLWLLCLGIRPLRPASWRVVRLQMLVWAAHWNTAIWLFWFHPLVFSWVLRSLME